MVEELYWLIIIITKLVVTILRCCAINCLFKLSHIDWYLNSLYFKLSSSAIIFRFYSKFTHFDL